MGIDRSTMRLNLFAQLALTTLLILSQQSYAVKIDNESTIQQVGQDEGELTQTDKIATVKEIKNWPEKKKCSLRDQYLKGLTPKELAYEKIESAIWNAKNLEALPARVG